MQLQEGDEVTFNGFKFKAPHPGCYEINYDPDTRMFEVLEVIKKQIYTQTERRWPED